MAKRPHRDYAQMNDPDLNPQFRRRWVEPESAREQKRKTRTELSRKRGTGRKPVRA